MLSYSCYFLHVHFSLLHPNQFSSTYGKLHFNAQRLKKIAAISDHQSVDVKLTKQHYNGELAAMPQKQKSCCLFWLFCWLSKMIAVPIRQSEMTANVFCSQSIEVKLTIVVIMLQWCDHHECEQTRVHSNAMSEFHASGTVAGIAGVVVRNAKDRSENCTAKWCVWYAKDLFASHIQNDPPLLCTCCIQIIHQFLFWHAIRQVLVSWKLWNYLHAILLTFDPSVHSSYFCFKHYIRVGSRYVMDDVMRLSFWKKSLAAAVETYNIVIMYSWVSVYKIYSNSRNIKNRKKALLTTLICINFVFLCITPLSFDEQTKEKKYRAWK